MKKRLKIPLKMKEIRHFELFGEEFLVQDIAFLNFSYIIIYTCDRFDKKELSNKFKTSQTFQKIDGVVFKTPSSMTVFSYLKRKVSVEFATELMLKILTQKMCCF